MNRQYRMRPLGVTILLALILIPFISTHAPAAEESNPFLIQLSSPIFETKIKDFPANRRGIISPDGKLLIIHNLDVTSFKSTYHIYDIATWQIVRKFEGISCSFSYDGKMLAVGELITIPTSKLVLTIYDVATWQINKTFDGMGVFMKNAGLLSVHDKQTSTIFDINSWEVIKSFQDAAGQESHDGKLFYVVSGIKARNNTTWVLYNLATWDKISTITGGVGYSLSNDSIYVLQQNHKADIWSTNIYSVPAGNLIRTFNKGVSFTEYNGRTYVNDFDAKYMPLNTYDLMTGQQVNVPVRRESPPSLSSDGKLKAIYNGTTVTIYKQTAQGQSLQTAFKKDEFESTSEYEERMKKWETPYTLRATLGKYDAESHRFEVEAAGNKILINVPGNKARELTDHKDKIYFEGKLKYYSPETLVLVDISLVDEITNDKFALNRQVEKTVAAKKESPPLSKDLDAKIGPLIEINSPVVKRGMKLVAKEARLAVAGKVTDDSGVAEVTVNGQPADLDENGNFSANILLKIGENTIVVAATNIKHNQTVERFTIVRGAGQIAQVPKETPAEDTVVIATGGYYALIIGNNEYKHLTKLQTAVKDAQEIAKVLKDNYGFKTKLLTNASRKVILSTLNDYRKSLKENDHFLIYYAGHGEFEKASNKAYWLPVDAQRDDPSEWIIADDITSNIKRISSRHILIVSDSCYSGTLDRTVETDLRKEGDRVVFMKKMLERPSRTLMSSGGNEPVSDAGGKGHSIFADSLLKALATVEDKTFTADELFYQQLRSRVAGRSDQVPEYKEIRNSGHEGGDFVFSKIK